MTLFGANEIHEGNYMPMFKVEGQIYLSDGNLFPNDNNQVVYKFI